MTTTLRPQRAHPFDLRRGEPGSRSRELLLAALVTAAVVSALSLLFNHAIDYDPDGWIVYARETFGPLAVNTDGFPAWKPLPILLIGPFTLITRGNADVYYWLFIARACAVLTVFGVAALAHRFAGRIAALLAAVFVVAAPYWFEDGTIGRDSAVSGALMTGAFLAHFHGRRNWAVVALAAMAMVRPEATPLLILYGLWMWRTRQGSLWFPALALALVTFMWLVPTIFQTGLSPFSISQNSAGAGTAGASSFPPLALVIYAAKEAHEVAALLVTIAIIASLYGLMRRRRGDGPDWLAGLWGRTSDELLVLGTAILWILIVAVETAKGFSGNPRYTAAAEALFFVVGAVVAVRAVERSRAAQITVAAVCAAATVALGVHPFDSARTLIQQRDRQAYNITKQLAMFKCPGYYVANQYNNAYLAELSGQPLQDSINWHLPKAYLKDGAYRFVYCKRS